LSQSYSKWTVNYNKSLTFNCSGIEIEIEISLLTKSGPVSAPSQNGLTMKVKSATYFKSNKKNMYQYDL
jgi:hypothetical protein